MIRKTVVIAMILILLVSGVVFADDIPDENLSSLSSAIKNNPVSLSEAGGNTLMGMSRDFLDIVRYIVVTALLVRMVMIFLDFSNAGDNPQLKASIKSKSIWLSLGIIFAINFWTIYRFTAGVMSNLSF